MVIELARFIVIGVTNQNLKIFVNKRKTLREVIMKDGVFELGDVVSRMLDSHATGKTYLVLALVAKVYPKESRVDLYQFARIPSDMPIATINRDGMSENWIGEEGYSWRFFCQDCLDELKRANELP